MTEGTVTQVLPGTMFRVELPASGRSSRITRPITTSSSVETKARIIQITDGDALETLALRPEVVDFDHADASAVVQSREQRGVKARRQRRGDARPRLFVGARPAAVICGLRRVILPVVVREQERSITVAQLQGWIGQRVRHTKTNKAGADTHVTILSSPVWWPRMKPAITMLSPVLTKARVLILASFESAPWLRS